jgi:hypothetical protein
MAGQLRKHVSRYRAEERSGEITGLVSFSMEIRVVVLVVHSQRSGENNRGSQFDE